MKRITKIDAAESAPQKKLRVAAYARVSTDSDEQLISLEAQKNHYEKYIKARRDWEYAGLYYDEGISGTKMAKRDGLLRMLADCDKGLIDYILIKSISRFSRNTVEFIETVRSLYSKGIYIFFEKENIDTGKMESELMLSILSGLAESESHSISENTKWSVQKRFRNGTYKFGYTPYGYRNDNGEMVVVEEQAEVVRWIFHQVLAGAGTLQIAKELNRKGIPSKKGGKWESGVIRALIANEKYIGDVLMQKTYSDERFTRHTNNGELPMYYLENHHEAIVSRETFDAANAMIERNGKEKGVVIGTQKYLNRYAFSGKVYCGECGGKMKRIKVSDYFGYGCNTHISESDKCGMKTVREEAIKAAFVTMLNKLVFARKQLLAVYAEELKKVGREPFYDRLNELDAALEENTRQKTRIQQYFTKGFIDPVVFEQKQSELAAEESTIRAELSSIERQINGSYSQRDALAELMQFTAKGKMLTEFSDELFTQFVDHIIVYSRTEVGFAMKCGPCFRERMD